MSDDERTPTVSEDIDRLARRLQHAADLQLPGLGDKRGGECRKNAKAFLELLAMGLTPTSAAQHLKVTRGGMYALRHRWAEFDDAWKEAEARGVGYLEDTAWHRAVIGTPKRIYHEGVCIGVERQVDNKVLMRLLEARSGKYARRIDVNVEGTINIAERIIEARKRVGITIEHDTQRLAPIDGAADNDDGDLADLLQ